MSIKLSRLVAGVASLALFCFPLAEPAYAVTGCTSGTVAESSSGNIRILTFSAAGNANGTCTFTVPVGVFVVDYLVVAGGGGGGSGGGGGGGVVYSDNPQSVDPGQDISITVGRGGAGGKGGISSTGEFPTNGSNSSFGTVEAIGGGAGGSWNRYATPQGSPNGSTGGSSGGDAYDASTTTGVTSSGSVIVGATSLGNAGGASSGGSYSAGGGGGGAGGAGQNSRRPNQSPTFSTNGCHTATSTNCTNMFYGGGAGGSGYSTDISGSTVEYGCGGGGGINSNQNAVISNAGGPAGCASAGRGSSWGFNNGTTNSANNATSGAAGRGGGGGGTDPEDVSGGSGGSGVVIVRYTIVDTNCPNDGNRTATAPLACPTEITIVADGSSNSIRVMGSPISFTGAGATLTVRSAPRASPTSGNLSWSISGNNIVMTVPAGSSLVGGTYPVVYRITQNNITSDSYVLVTVEDPEQLTPGTIPLDPRDGEIILPRIELGAAPNVRLCLTLATNTDGLSLAAPTSSGVTITNPTTNRLVLVGTNANVEAAVNSISITALSGSSLVPNGGSRNLEVNVSNTNNGGNGSCTFGTSSTIQLKALELSTAQHVNIDLD